MNQTQLASAINAANKKQCSVALVVQAYCNSTLQQPPIDLSGFKDLNTYQTQINNALTKAQGHASYYLDSLQNQIIANIDNIVSYYNLHKAVLTTLPEGSTEQQWDEAINALLEESENYSTTARNLAVSINEFYNELNIDDQNYAAVVSSLNSAVNGDNGVLATEKQELNSLNKDIAGEEVGITLSAIGIIGGIISIIVGVIENIAVPGSGTALIIGGSVSVATGITGETASSVELVASLNAKGALMANESRLTTEVKLANIVTSIFSSLKNAVQNAITASEQMSDAWESLNTDLSNLSSDLKSGLKNADEIRTLFLTAANSEVQQVIQDADNIKDQLDGVAIVQTPSNQTLQDYLANQA